MDVRNAATFEEKALVQAFCGGDEFAFVSLYNRYKTPVYAFCVKMLMSREAAQDVLQDTFLRVYENRHQLVKSDAFKAWVYTIARNQCLNYLRRAGRNVSLEEAPTTLSTERPTPFMQLEKNEQITLLNTFLWKLKPEYREVLILREYQNLSYEEIAGVTRSTVGSVKSRLHKARKKLAAFLRPFLVDTPSVLAPPVQVSSSINQRSHV